jgi:hypothetical protein
VFDEVAVVSFALDLDIGSERLSDWLEISISVFELNSLESGEIFLPSVVNFSSSSFSGTGLSYIPTHSGTYRLNVSLHGPPGGMCSFREIGEDATRMFIITVLSAIISAPFALTVQYVTGCIPSKESLTRSDLEKIKNSSLGSSNRRTAVVAAEGTEPEWSFSHLLSLVNPFSSSTEEETDAHNELMKELLEVRKKWFVNTDGSQKETPQRLAKTNLDRKPEGGRRVRRSEILVHFLESGVIVSRCPREWIDSRVQYSLAQEETWE